MEGEGNAMKNEKTEKKILTDEQLDLVAGGGSNDHENVTSIYMSGTHIRNVETNDGGGLSMKLMDNDNATGRTW